VDFGESIQAVLLLPAGLTLGLLRGINTSVGLYVNVSTWPQANYIQGTIGNATTNALTQFLGRTGLTVERNVTVLMPAPPVGGSLSFNLSLVNQDIGFPVTIGGVVQDILSTNTNVSLAPCDTRVEVIESIRSETSIVGVYVPENFTTVLLTGGKPSVEIFVNGIETTEASTALAAIQQALADAAKSVLGRGTDVTITYVYGAAGMSMIQLAGPSVIGFFALFFGFIISGVFFLRERQQGTLERMRASPLSDLEVVFGYIIAFIAVSIVQTTLITLVIVYYSPSILSAMGMLILPILLLAVQSVTLAIAASYRMKTELQVIQMIPIFIIPQIFLCGIFFPVSLLPSYLSFLPYLFPLTYYVMAVKGVVFFGATLVDIVIPIIALSLYAVLGVALAVARRPES
jgi:ABC-2 type transport system permease protein